MSREVLSYALLHFLSLHVFIFHVTESRASPDDCLDLDVAMLEDYLSQLEFEELPSVSMMTGGFKCPVTDLPFGALKSDWSRLLLLRDALPKGSPLRDTLSRLFRILVVAYYRMEERFDVSGGSYDESRRNETIVVNATTQKNRESINEEINNRFDGTVAVAASTSVDPRDRQTFTTDNAEHGTQLYGSVSPETSSIDIQSFTDETEKTVDTTRFISDETAAISMSTIDGEKETIVPDTNNRENDSKKLDDEVDVSPNLENSTRIDPEDRERSTTVVEATSIVSSEKETRTTTEGCCYTMRSITSDSTSTSSPEMLDDTTTTEKRYDDRIDSEENYVVGRPVKNWLKNFSDLPLDGIYQVFVDDSSQPDPTKNNSLYRAGEHKMRKPPILRRPPATKDLWKHIVTSQKFVSTTIAASETLTDEKEDDGGYRGGRSRSGKRGSSNSDDEKTFRWFYNFDREASSYSSVPTMEKDFEVDCDTEKRRRD